MLRAFLAEILPGERTEEDAGGTARSGRREGLWKKSRAIARSRSLT